MPDPARAVAARLLELFGAFPASGDPLPCVASSDPRLIYPLRPGEETAGMVPKRVAEFSAGRHAARLAMAQVPGPALGQTSVPQGPDRAPVWPSGVAGSITHCETICLAAVSTRHRGIGIDIEQNGPLPPGVRELVICPGDRVRGMDGSDDGMLIFCAKEAAFKAQYAVSRTLLGPADLEIDIGQDTQFTARFTRAISAFRKGDVLHGRIAAVAGHVLAVSIV